MKRLTGIALLLLLCSAAVRAELEPNNTPEQANLLLYNGVDSGSMSANDIYDWFYFDLPQAGAWQLTIAKTGGGNVWFNLCAGETVNKEVISTYYISYWDVAADVWSAALLPGRYYIQIRKGDYVVNYRIASQLVPTPWSSDPEPNNTAATAISMPINSTVSGTLHYTKADGTVDQDDWYLVEMPQAGFLHVVTDKKGPGNAWVYVLDAENPALPELTNLYFQYFESPPGGWELHFPAQAGRYYLHVGNGAGVVNYQIKAELIKPPFAEDIEPNDNQTAALPFPMNSSVTGILGHYQPNVGYDATDWYVLNVPEDGLLEFNVTKLSFSNCDIHLRDENGVIGGAYISYGDGVATFQHHAGAGTYYLAIEALDLFLYYKITLTYTPAPVADFVVRQAGGTVAFDNQTLQGASYAWSFDDGATASTVNAYHEYTQPGNYNVCLIASNPGGKDTVCRTVVVPGLARAYPDKAGNTGDATLRIFGGGLDTAYRVRLVQGGATVAQSAFTGFGGKNAILCQLDLRGAPLGVCDLVVEKTGGPAYTLPGGFTILPGTPPQPWVSITGRDRILYNTWTTFTVQYGNKGNADARLVPVWFAFEQAPGLEVEFPNAFFFDPDIDSGEPQQEGLYVDLDSLFGKPYPVRLYPLLLPLIPAGSVQSFQIRIKTGGNVGIHAWAEMPWYQSPVNDNKLECLSDALRETPPDWNLNEDRVLCAKYFTAIFYDRILDDYFIDTRNNPSLQQPDFFSSIVKCLRAAVKICGVSNAADRKDISDWLTNWIINRQMTDRTAQAKGSSCPLEFAPQNLQSKPMTAVASLDPNEKTGLNGYGAPHYLAGREQMPYIIHFENTAAATAPAHTVMVTDWLDTAKFDLNTFTFGDVSIGSQTFRLRSGVRELVQDVYLNDRGVTLRILGTVDVATGKVEWVFRSLDSLTLQDIDDPDKGFLPPNVSAPEGEGSVSFAIRLKALPVHGTQVRNDALIVFDANLPIATNEHFLTFDRLAPESTVQPLPPVIQDKPFTVEWIGSDKGSGISYYNVYVSVNGGPDSLWIGGATDLSAGFTGQVGNTYRFYSLATDHVGNVETIPAIPDAVTTITVSAHDPAGADAGLTLLPNPVRDRLLVQYTGNNPGCLTLIAPDGRQVRRICLEGPGQTEINTADLPNGLYAWTWAQAGRMPVRSGKVVVIRN